MKALYSLFGAAIFMLAFQPLSAQLNLSWEEIGPNNLGNHARAMAVDGNGTVWGGGPGSGLWKSTNNGASWEQVTGISDNYAVSSIAIDGANIYVGTGELVFFRADEEFIPLSAQWTPSSVFSWQHGFFQYAGLAGQGVFVSNDGGMTWSHSNGTWNGNSTLQNNPFASIQEIEKSGQRTYIATMEGLYYSDDANLATVTKASGSADFENSPILDIAIGASGTILATTKDSIYLSTNNGTAFPTAINERILPASVFPGNQVGGNRIVLASAPSNPNTIYVSGVISTNNSCSGVFRSTDNAQTFERIAPVESSSFQPCQSNGRYALTLEVDPSDADRILLGGQTLYEYSEGKGWTNSVTHNFVGGVTTNYVPVPILSIALIPAIQTCFSWARTRKSWALLMAAKTSPSRQKASTPHTCKPFP